MKKLKEQSGDFAIDGAFKLLLVFALLALFISVVAIGSRASKLHNMASELLRYIEVRGQVDAAYQTELARLERITGMDVDCTISADYIGGTRRVQFGDVMTVQLEYDTSFGIGGALQVPFTLRTTVSGRSEQYWK